MLCCPSFFCPQSFPASVFFPVSRLFTSGGQYCSFSFSISLFNEYSGLISFRTDWFDLLAVQGTLKSLLQHHSSKASILWHSAFFMVQFSYPYMTTIALTIWTLSVIAQKSPYMQKCENIHGEMSPNNYTQTFQNQSPAFSIKN